LVFGKVNAGKSSFSNFVADTFPQEKAKYFYLDNGKVKFIADSFAEGVTETTARIQGVELGSKLIILDSPGLHSVTDENGAITRTYTDSADVVMWLTPSTSPGQVQELSDLKVELASKKPLLPVITRSDTFEEDIDDNDEIVKILLNKSSENRSMQEDDVHKRARESLGEGSEVRMPLSISVHCYRESDRSEKDLAESGLKGLLENMAGIVNEAQVYKHTKAKQQVLNYLEKTVLSGVLEDVQPKVRNMKEVVSTQRELRKQLELSAVQEILLDLHVLVPDWAEKYKASKNVTGFSQEITAYIQNEIKNRISQQIKRFVSNIDDVLIELNQDSFGSFENVEVSYEQVTGKTAKAGSAAAGGAAGAYGGAMAGAAIGTAVPIIGTAIGGLVGGMLGGLFGGAAGNAAGDYFVETEIVQKTIGVNTDLLITKTMNSLEKGLPAIVAEAFKAWDESLSCVEVFSKKIEEEISIFENKLNDAKGSV
jgi:hypothetical protein